MSQKTRAASESIGFLAIAAGVLVLLNVLGFMGAFMRLDLTENQLFTLSDSSKRLAHRLTDRLTIKAYFTSDLPPPYNATERYVRDILTEYQVASGGKIEIEYIDPDTDELRQQADTDGVQKVSHRVIENDSFVERDGYRGLVIQYLDKREVLPVIEDTSGLEYTLTMTLKKLLGETKTIGILSGSGSLGLSAELTSLREALPSYEFEEVNGTEEIDDELAALLVVGPTESIPDDVLRRIDQYVMTGGSLGVFAGSEQFTLQQQGPEGMPPPPPSAGPIDTHLNTLLRPWGVEIQNGMVADAQCERYPLRTRFGFAIPVPHLVVPVITFGEEAEHPALFRIESAPFFFPSPLRTTNALRDDDEVKTTVLGRSTDNSWIVSGDSIPLLPTGRENDWPETNENGPFPLLVALEGKLPSAFATAASTEPSAIEAPARAVESARVFIAGSSFVLRNEVIPPINPETNERQLTSTFALVLNVIDWLAQDSDLVAIRVKNIEDPRIEVPATVTSAEEDAQSSEEEARAALMEAQQAQDREGLEKNKQKMDDAIERRDEALERRKAEIAKWDAKKAMYRWGNILGIPFLFALFGVIRWQMRKAAKKNVKL